MQGSSGSAVDRLLEQVRRDLDRVEPGDLAAEVAAGKTAASRVERLIAQYGIDTFREAVPALLDHAEQLTRRELLRIPDGTYEFVDHMDSDGIDLDRLLDIRVQVTIRGHSPIVVPWPSRLPLQHFNVFMSCLS